MEHGKLVSLSVGFGAWLIALALSILDAPQWLGWLAFAMGCGFIITAALLWAHGALGPLAETGSQRMSAFIRQRAKQAKNDSEKTRHRLSRQIDHKDGCLAKEDRIELDRMIRPDGIEVTRVHCLDCGELHYEHGSTPTHPPAPSSVTGDPGALKSTTGAVADFVLELRDLRHRIDTFGFRDPADQWVLPLKSEAVVERANRFLSHYIAEWRNRFHPDRVTASDAHGMADYLDSRIAELEEVQTLHTPTRFPGSEFDAFRPNPGEWTDEVDQP